MVLKEAVRVFLFLINTVTLVLGIAISALGRLLELCYISGNIVQAYMQINCDLNGYQ